MDNIIKTENVWKIIVDQLCKDLANGHNQPNVGNKFTNRIKIKVSY